MYLKAEEISQPLLDEAVEALRRAFRIRYCLISFFFPDGNTVCAASGEGPSAWREFGPSTIIDLAAEAAFDYSYDILELKDKTITVFLTTPELRDNHLRKFCILMLSLFGAVRKESKMR